MKRLLTCTLFSATLLGLLLLSATASGGAVPAADSPTAPPEVRIAGTQSLHLTSAILGAEFNLYVNLPREYQDSTKLLPVIYLIDGQWDFPLLNAIFGQQYYDGYVPGVIVVGIAWGGENPNFDSLRARDLTPTPMGQASFTGNAPKFLQFIKTEVIPFVDAHYRTDRSDRTLMGSSLGGLFTLYALFEETSLFNRYVLTSPAIGWDGGVISTYEKNYTHDKSGRPVRLFMAVGGMEGNAPAFEKFAADLKEKKLEGLEMETRVIEGIGHSGGKAEGYTRGLQFVFAKPELKLAPEILDRYAGWYEVGPGVKAQIVRDEDKLTALLPDGSKITMFAQSETDFYMKGVYLVVHFKVGEKGKVTGFQLEQFTGRQFVKRVE